MSKKLIRATVPICPDCGNVVHEYDGEEWQCDGCLPSDYVIVAEPDWGYYAPDIDGVIGEMEGALTRPKSYAGAGYTEIGDSQLRDWIARLKGTK